MGRWIVSKDALLSQRKAGWVFSNPRMRTHILVDQAAIQALCGPSSSLTGEQWSEKLSAVSGRNITNRAYGAQGLHNDHTGLADVAGEACSGDALFMLLKELWILVDAEGDTIYKNARAPLTSILDRANLGTFHQRVGQYLTVEKRLRGERWRWWHDQKFDPEGLSVKPGPYKYMQEDFIAAYFGAVDLQGKKILDFGCGNGFYSSQLASRGASVTGLDLSAELIEMARKNYGRQVEFILPESPEAGLKFLRDHKNAFDIVFMQDVLLILINPEDSKTGTDSLPDLLRALHDCQKQGGLLYTMEPNTTFWLAARYGDPSDPYAIVTEYQDKVFHVAPALPDVMAYMADAGYALKEYKHPPARAGEGWDKDHARYANAFCIWDFMCFIAL